MSVVFWSGASDQELAQWATQRLLAAPATEVSTRSNPAGPRKLKRSTKKMKVVVTKKDEAGSPDEDEKGGTHWFKGTSIIRQSQMELAR